LLGHEGEELAAIRAMVGLALSLRVQSRPRGCLLAWGSNHSGRPLADRPVSRPAAGARGLACSCDEPLSQGLQEKKRKQGGGEIEDSGQEKDKLPTSGPGWEQIC
jgi:hypothetical protein